MKQLTLIPKRREAHGGAHSVGKRRSRRPLSIKRPHHVTLRSEKAKGLRSLLKNRDIVEAISRKAARRFRIRIYERAVCGNHLHFLVKAKTRVELQNFFRVLAGHIAQEILQRYPLQKHEFRAAGGAPEVS